jgi:hypothetical protein
MTHPYWTESSEYLACSRCGRTLREVAEILLDQATLAGTLHLAADPPYFPRLTNRLPRATSSS